MIDDAESFETHRPALLALAYRMLGDMARAEDTVQETWVRWQNRRSDVEEPKGVGARTQRAEAGASVVKLGEAIMILELYRQGLTVSEIARQTGMDRKTVRKYLAYTTLPEVRAVMSSDCRIGTPEESRVESVRENLATAIFRKMSPRIGIFKINASMNRRPPGVL